MKYWKENTCEMNNLPSLATVWSSVEEFTSGAPWSGAVLVSWTYGWHLAQANVELSPVVNSCQKNDLSLQKTKKYIGETSKKLGDTRKCNATTRNRQNKVSVLQQKYLIKKNKKNTPFTCPVC